jgi:hypothetical protein
MPCPLSRTHTIVRSGGQSHRYGKRIFKELTPLMQQPASGCTGVVSDRPSAPPGATRHMQPPCQPPDRGENPEKRGLTLPGATKSVTSGVTDLVGVWPSLSHQGNPQPARATRSMSDARALCPHARTRARTRVGALARPPRRGWGRGKFAHEEIFRSPLSIFAPDLIMRG